MIANATYLRDPMCDLLEIDWCNLSQHHQVADYVQLLVDKIPAVTDLCVYT